MLQFHNQPHVHWITIFSMAIVSLSLILLIYQTSLLDRTLSRRTDAIENAIADANRNAARDRSETEHNLKIMRKYVDEQHRILNDIQSRLSATENKN